MNTKISFLTLILVTLFSYSYAQDISYYLVSDDHEDIQQTHFVISADSLFQKPLLTQSFISNPIIFQVPDSIRCYYLQVSHLNYYKVQRKVCHPKVIDTIQLYRIPNQLDEVVLQGTRRTKIAVKGNTAELSIGKITQNSSVDAAALLKTIPEVFVMPQGGIKLRGQSVKNIYLHMGYDSPGVKISQGELDVLEPSTIGKVVAFYNEAEIHIYKKQLKKGYQIKNTVTATKGKRYYYSIYPRLSYCKNKTSFWLDIPMLTNSQENETNGEYKILYKDEPLSLKGSSLSLLDNKHIKFKTILEHNIDSTQVIGFRVSYGVKHDNRSDVYLSESEKSLNNAKTKSNNHIKTINSSIYYRTKLLKKWNLTLKTGMIANRQVDDLNSNFIYDVNQGSSIGYQNLDKNNRSLGVVEELDLNRTFRRGTTFNLLFKNEVVNVKTDVRTSQLLLSQNKIDTIFTDNLSQNNIEIQTRFSTTVFNKINMDFSSAYFTYQQSSFPQSTEKLVTISKGYFKPAISLTYPTKKRNYTLFAKKMINMISLSRYVYNTHSSDGFTIDKNNQELKPAIYYQFGASTSLFKNLYTTVMYLNGHNTFMYYPLFDDKGVFLGSHQINLCENNQLSLSLFYSRYLTKKIFTSTNVNLTHTTWSNKTPYLFNTDFNDLFINQTLNYAPTNRWSSSLDFTYKSRSKISENIDFKPWIFLNLSVSRRLNKYFDCYIKISDIFHLYKMDLYTTNQNVIYSSNLSLDYTFVKIGLTYNLNYNFKTKQKTKENIQDLEKRLEL